MNNPSANILSLVHDSVPIVERHAVENFDAGKLLKEFETQASSLKMQVMLYGAYNAGKSTLINAFLSREAAVVNDVPTTDRVDFYDWEGVDLLDTPGVNAPIEHEQVTDEQLKRVGAVLFLIREGDLDTESLYQRLFDIMSRGKKVFILLNHQFTQIEDKLAAIHKINQTLARLSAKHGITVEQCGAVSVFPLNALTAYKGRLNKQDKLTEHAGFNDFITAFRLWLTDQNQQSDRLQHLKQQINECWYIPTIDQLKSKLDCQSNDQEIRLRDSKQVLESKLIRLKSDALRFVHRKVSDQKSNVLDVIENSTSEPEVIQKIEALFQPLGPDIESWLIKELESINDASVVVSYDDANVKALGQQSDESRRAELYAQIGNQIKNTLQDKDKVKQLLLLGRKLKVPGLKGRWEKTLGNWAGKATVAVKVATFAYETYQAHSEQEKANQEERSRTVELYQAAESICNTVADRYTQSAQELISQCLDVQIADISHQLIDLSAQAGSIKSDYEVLCQSQLSVSRA